MVSAYFLKDKAGKNEYLFFTVSLVYLYVFKNLQPNPSSNDTFNMPQKQRHMWEIWTVTNDDRNFWKIQTSERKHSWQRRTMRAAGGS